LEPQQALSQAEYIGTLLGKAIAGMGYQQVHLIAHSAGSGMIQAIADQLQAAPNPPLIQLTFLDPYIGIFHQEQNNYGKNADWSDCYFVEDGTRGFTGSYLNHAFNVDVSWVDPAHTTAPYSVLVAEKWRFLRTVIRLIFISDQSRAEFFMLFAYDLH